MMNILKADECLENLAGISSDVYVGVKSDLAAPLTAEENVESAKGRSKAFIRLW